MVIIRHEFSEAASGYKYPVVAHEFAGETLDEARRYFTAHQRYDRMLRAVSSLGHGSKGATGEWNGIKFRSVIRVTYR